MTEVALFPIPNLVSFPGTLVPLHVFEPRYRALIKESVKAKRPIGVAHTKKVLAKASHSGSMADKLNKNQDTYEPFEVFSAGLCEITDVTGDGRILAEVRMDKRYRLGEMIQEVPYKIYRCEDYDDVEESGVKAVDPADLKVKLDQFLVQSVGEKEEQLKALFESESWRSLPLDSYSFSVFQILKFNPEKMQEILELQSPGARMQRAWDEIESNI